MRLVIGNKNYSSWSLRAWLLLRQAGIEFDEVKLSFNDPAMRETVRRYSGAGRVPVLIDDEGLVVHDSLAIAEYVAERFPDRGLWPDGRAARAHARAICAEMHAGFAALRRTMPMNCEARFELSPVPVAVQDEIDRIVEIWSEARRRYGSGGPLLFGRFGVADAFFAPVCVRFVGHRVALPPQAEHYVETVLELPAMREWTDAALAEREYVEEDEPYRPRPG